MSSGLPERKEHPATAHITSMRLTSPGIDEAELKLLTPPPPTHDRVLPFALPTPGFIENQMDQEQPPDSTWGIPASDAFPNVYTVKRHSSVHSSVVPKHFLRNFLPVPAAVDLVIGHLIDSFPSVAASGLVGFVPGFFLRRSAPLPSRLLRGAVTGFVTASVFFPVSRFVQYQLYVRARLDADSKTKTPPAVPMSARQSWYGMDEEGNVFRTSGTLTYNPYQAWEEDNWQGRKRDIWEAIHRKLDDEKMKEALQKRALRKTGATQTKASEEEHH